MTDELQELELLEEAPAESQAAPDPNAAGMAAALAAGAPVMPGVMPAPAFNPLADKEYYRFFFSGLVMFLGCLMPWGTDSWEAAGYHTLGGALTMILALLIMWSWWGAIATRRFGGGLKWVFLATLPLIFQIMGFIAAFDQPDVQALSNAPDGWGDVFAKMFAMEDPAAQQSAAQFLATYGVGKLVVLLGAVLAELFLLMAVFGGAKTAKAQKAARQAEAAASRGSRSGGGRRR